jgi:flagellar biosynthesis protein
MSGRRRHIRTAAALRYDVGSSTVPTVVASGKGRLAERIVEIAREAGIPLREDAVLAEALAALEVGADVPPDLYQAVAEALVWAYRLSASRSAPAGV